jgi:hypothetical protein
MTERITIDFNGYSRSVDVPDGTCDAIYEAFSANQWRPTIPNPVPQPEFGTPEYDAWEGPVLANPEDKRDFTIASIRQHVESRFVVPETPPA